MSFPAGSCEFFFTFVFGAEAAIKLWALRPVLHFEAFCQLLMTFCR